MGRRSDDDEAVLVGVALEPRVSIGALAAAVVDAEEHRRIGLHPVRHVEVRLRGAAGTSVVHASLPTRGVRLGGRATRAAPAERRQVSVRSRSMEVVLVTQGGASARSLSGDARCVLAFVARPSHFRARDALCNVQGKIQPCEISAAGARSGEASNPLHGREARRGFAHGQHWHR